MQRCLCDMDLLLSGPGQVDENVSSPSDTDLVKEMGRGRSLSKGGKERVDMAHGYVHPSPFDSPPICVP